MSNKYDVIVIGSGIAGMTAAIYLKRSDLNVMIMESDTPGGQLTKAYKIENYPGFSSVNGADLAYNIYEQVNNLKIDFKYEAAIDVIDNGQEKIVKTSNNEYRAKAIIIATGRSPRNLKLENEDKFIGKGISYCATCDGALYKDKEVLVVGGGNSAVGESLFLADICKKVTLVHRGNNFKSNVDEERIDRLEDLKNINIIYDSEVTEYIGEDKLNKVKLHNNKTGSESTLDIDGLFLFIGAVPNSKLFAKFNMLNEYGYIKVNSKMETNVEGIFACGDVIEKNVYQLVTASGEGAVAATSLEKYLKG